MIRLEMKSYITILIEKQQLYLHYHQVKWIRMNFTGEEILPPVQSQMVDQTKFKYVSLGKAFKTQTKVLED